MSGDKTRKDSPVALKDYDIEDLLRQCISTNRKRRFAQFLADLAEKGFRPEELKALAHAAAQPTKAVDDDRKSRGRPWPTREEWEKSRANIPLELSKLKSVRQVVEWLYHAGQRFLIANVRYYHLYAAAARRPDVLLSIDCAGDNDEAAERIRYGVSKERCATVDSFLCFEHGLPIVVLVDDRVSHLEKGNPIGGRFPFFVAPDNCGMDLNRLAPRLHVDIPVLVAGMPVLKFSCDFCVTNPALIKASEIEEFWQLAQLAGVMLQAMHQQELTRRQEGVRGPIMALRGRKQIWRYIDEELPKRFNCEGALFYEFRKDSRLGGSGTACDVLAPMSGGGERDDSAIGVRSYNSCGDSRRHLIPRVASIRRPLHFNDAGNERLRAKQCEEYQVEVDWDDSHNDWAAMGSVTAIPVMWPNSDENDVMGVLLLYGKQRSGESGLAHFTWWDVQLAEWIANECLAIRLEALKVGSGLESAFQALPLKEASGLRDDRDHWPQAVIRLLKRLVPEEGSRKLYGVFLTNEEKTKLSVAASDGALDNKCSERRDLLTKTTVTLVAMREPAGGVVYRNTIGSLQWLTPGAVCELACAVSGRRGPLGAIVVKSDRYDLSIAEHGPYLKVLASWTGEVLKETMEDSGSNDAG